MTFLFLRLNSSPTVPELNTDQLSPSSEDLAHISPEMQKGDAIMGKLGNETVKAELGRAAWKLFHTTMARFPDKPTAEESAALRSYIYLFARLYPCGECATHFQKILSKFPPQTSSRSTAAAWACHVHNEVNKSKNKPLFDCTKIGDFYDCGCGDDHDKSNDGGKGETAKVPPSKAGQDGRDIKQNNIEPVQIEREGPMNGG